MSLTHVAGMYSIDTLDTVAPILRYPGRRPMYTQTGRAAQRLYSCNNHEYSLCYF